MNAKMFMGGIPYGPDVNRLRVAFPHESLKEQLIVEHSQIEQALQFKRVSSRYRGVVNSWIAAMYRDYNINIKALRGVGFQVLDNQGLLSDVSKQSESRGALHVAALGKYRRINPVKLSEGDRRLYEHKARHAAILAANIKETQRQMFQLPPVEHLPFKQLSTEQDEK